MNLLQWVLHARLRVAAAAEGERFLVVLELIAQIDLRQVGDGVRRGGGGPKLGDGREAGGIEVTSLAVEILDGAVAA